MNAQTALVPRTTMTEIEGLRARAISLFLEAQEKLTDAMAAARAAAGGTGFRLDGSTAAKMLYARADNDNAFLAEVTKSTDQAIWNYLLHGFGFEKLLDRQAMEEFRAQIDRDPPAVTAETAEATMRRLLEDADMMFKRGIANAFSKLDRRFRSHNGFSIGERIVLTYAFTETGSWSHSYRREDTIRDIERVFMELDGKEMPDRYAGIVGLIDDARHKNGYQRGAFNVENDYFRVKAYKNGNCHIWFKRDDLVESVNRLLASYYGEVLGDASDDVTKGDPFATRSTAVARNMGWFPTPAYVVGRATDRASLYWPRPAEGEAKQVVRILEPSAGEGALALGVLEYLDDNHVEVDTHTVCVELHPDRAAKLRDLARFTEVIQGDFLDMNEASLGGLFDRIVMNPPFAHEMDIDHVVHAARLLKPGGVLVAIMSAGAEFRQTRKAIAFREMIEAMKGEMHDLPAGSFAESGTMINTCLVMLRAPRQA